MKLERDSLLKKAGFYDTVMGESLSRGSHRNIITAGAQLPLLVVRGMVTGGNRALQRRLNRSPCHWLLLKGKHSR